MKRTYSINSLLLFVGVIVMTAIPSFAQSSDQNFPTPVTSTEIRGAIRARDIGDSRSTTYFYAFDGEQGDIFVNIQTKNFDGDIDVFTADNLKPLTKIVLYSDAGLSETGRIVYLRKPERLLLRIEGRTPDDNPASFVIKFAGSFVALKPSRKGDDNGPVVGSNAGDGVRLSSAGAVIPATPNLKKDPTKVTRPEAISVSPTKPKVTETSKTDKTSVSEKPKNVPTKTTSTEKPASDPLAGVRLVIVLKNGKTFERPMNQVLRFTADQGTVTVIGKDGTIVRYLITDVAKFTMQ